MHGAGDHLLAGAGLAEDQDRRIGRRDLPHDVEHSQQARILADDAVESLGRVDLVAQIFVGEVLLVLLEALLDLGPELVEVDGLLDVVRRALLHGIDRDFSAAVAGQDQALDRTCSAPSRP